MSGVGSRVVLAGASGGIGAAVIRALAADHEVVALTRSPARSRREDVHAVEWRHCDLFSRSEVAAALAGGGTAVYLVHSRLPSARLDQAQCDDMDLLMADNFARGAARGGIEQIVCVREPAPAADTAPAMRERRSEVTDALGGHGVPVTVIHADVVIAPGGTVMELFTRLATQGPFVPLPAWAERRRQPIALPDLARAVRHCVSKPATRERHLAVGGPTVLGLRELLESVSLALAGRRPRFVPLAWLTPGLYRCWIRLLCPRAHPTLVEGVVEQLAHDGVAEDSELQRFLDDGALPLAAALEQVARGVGGQPAGNPRQAHREEDDAWLRAARTVRSIQRYRCPPGRGAPWLAATYFRWLPRFVWPFVTCDTDASGTVSISVRFLRIRLLVLSPQPDRSDADRVIYFIVGGALASRREGTRGRMEFRDVLGGRHTIVAIHDFEPHLPWNFYHATQATAHSIVMRAFERHLARRGDAA